MQGRALRRLPRTPMLSFLASVVVGVIAGLTLTVVGHWSAGLALLLGLLIGGSNALLLQRSVTVGMPFAALSLGRIGLLSAIALGAGLVIGPDVAWLSLLGAGVSQLLMAGISAVEIART